MSRSFAWSGLPLILLLSFAFSAFAEPAPLVCNNRSFTHFGLGVESLNYQETFTASDGGQIETDTTLTNVIQRSGGYTYVSPQGGFYLNTASTLSGGTDQESWKHDTLGTLQTDEMKASVAELNILGAWHFSPAHHLVAGPQVFTMNFSRTGWDTGSGVQMEPLGAISEDSLSVDAVVGYRFDSFFRDPEAPLRLLGGVTASLPLYYRVYNSGGSMRDQTSGAITTQAPVELTDSFSGYGLSADAGLGWRLNDNFTLTGRLEAALKERDEIKEGGFTLPEVTVTTLRAMLGLIWSF